MTTLQLVDVFRWTNAGLAIALIACNGPAIYAAQNLGQRFRFMGSLMVGVILCSATFAARGRPPVFSWYAPAVTICVLFLLLGTVLFLHDDRRRWRAGRRKAPGE